MVADRADDTTPASEEKAQKGKTLPYLSLHHTAIWFSITFQFLFCKYMQNFILKFIYLAV
jgi:hypothetical protein